MQSSTQASKQEQNKKYLRRQSFGMISEATNDFMLVQVSSVCLSSI